jgi:hypothetical protein
MQQRRWIPDSAAKSSHGVILREAKRSRRIPL